jgi:hypothetical protein
MNLYYTTIIINDALINIFTLLGFNTKNKKNLSTIQDIAKLESSNL